MRENTKKYFKELIDDVSIEVNTIEFALVDIQKSLKKLRQLYDKVIKKL